MERLNVFYLNSDSDALEIDHEELVIRRESAALAKERQDINERYGKQMHKSLTVELVWYVFYSVAFCVAGLCLLYSLLGGDGFRPVLAVIAAVVFLATAIVIAVRRKLKKSGERDKKLTDIDDEMGRLRAMSEKELNIPSDAKTVEIMTYYYHEDNEDIESVNDDMQLFEEDGIVCLHWGGAVYGVPRDSIEALVKVEEEITFPEWWKEEPYDGEKYARYGVRKNGGNEYLETFSADFYYSLRFSKDGKAFEIVIPPYEIETALEVLKIEPVTE